jgi:DNA-binding transcriptional ArsR family regulator
VKADIGQKEEIFEALSSDRRVEIVNEISESGTMNIQDLVAEISSVENNKPREKLSDTEIERVRIPLIQTHIPILTHHNIIEYDIETSEISEGKKFDEALSLIQDTYEIIGIDWDAYPELDETALFDLLSSSRRRNIIRILQSEQSPIQFTNLVENVAAKENNVPVSELTSKDRKRYYVSLYQTHVPKLEEAGLVDYDQESREVSLNKSRIESRHSESASQSEFLIIKNRLKEPLVLYIIVSTFGIGILAAQYLNVNFIQRFNPIIWFTLYSIAIAMITLYNLISQYR